MLKVLIADDEVIERLVLEKKLKKYYSDECRILVAQNGRQVLEIYDLEHPQILILDIEMPGIDGLEAARQIRKKDKMCSIIFLTAFDEFSYAKAAISVHALDYLLKPCDDHDLMSACDEAIRLAHSAAAYEERMAETRPEPSDHNALNQETMNQDPSIHKTSSQEVPDEQPEEEQRQEEFRAFIVHHYMEDIAVKDIAGHFGYSEAYFCKRFKQYFGHSFVSYLTDYRMQRAEELMRTSSLSIKEIGKAVGYPDPNYFTKVFRRVRGVSPSGFRDLKKQ